jgi:hypothetical protein
MDFISPLLNGAGGSNREIDPITTNAAAGQRATQNKGSRFFP